MTQTNVGRLQSQVGRLSNELEALRRRGTTSSAATPQGIFAPPAAHAASVARAAVGGKLYGGEVGEPAPWYILVDRVRVAGARIVDFAPNMVSAVVSCACEDNDHSLTMINIVTR